MPKLLALLLLLLSLLLFNIKILNQTQCSFLIAKIYAKCIHLIRVIVAALQIETHSNAPNWDHLQADTGQLMFCPATMSDGGRYFIYGIAPLLLAPPPWEKATTNKYFSFVKSLKYTLMNDNKSN